MATDEKLSEIDAIEALRIDDDTFARESRFLLLRMRMMGMRPDRSFVQRDVFQARAHFGRCIAAPRLPSIGSGQTLGRVTLE